MRTIQIGDCRDDLILRLPNGEEIQVVHCLNFQEKPYLCITLPRDMEVTATIKDGLGRTVEAESLYINL